MMDAEIIIRQVAGSMALSGFDLTEEDESRIRELWEHPEQHEAMLQELIAKHSKRYADNYNTKER